MHLCSSVDFPQFFFMVQSDSEVLWDPKTGSQCCESQGAVWTVSHRKWLRWQMFERSDAEAGSLGNAALLGGKKSIPVHVNCCFLPPSPRPPPLELGDHRSCHWEARAANTHTHSASREQSAYVAVVWGRRAPRWLQLGPQEPMFS